MSSPRSLLEADGLVKRFGGLVAIDGVALNVEEASITLLVGPNGAGKTTLFDVVSGFERPDRGVVRFAGQRIDGRPPHFIAGLGLVRTFQLTRPLRSMTVRENIMLAGRRQPGESLWRALASRNATRRREREVERAALDVLESVGLDEMTDAAAASLSDGQRRLLEFARALTTEPRMVLLDEPTAGLHPTATTRLLDRMRELRRDQGVTFLVIEHDLRVIGSVADRVVVMNHGRVIGDGPPTEVAADPRVIDAYLGPAPSTTAAAPESTSPITEADR